MPRLVEPEPLGRALERASTCAGLCSLSRELLGRSVQQDRRHTCRGRHVSYVVAELADHERDLVRGCTNAGRAAARARGRTASFLVQLSAALVRGAGRMHERNDTTVALSGDVLGGRRATTSGAHDRPPTSRAPRPTIGCIDADIRRRGRAEPADRPGVAGAAPARGSWCSRVLPVFVGRAGQHAHVSKATAGRAEAARHRHVDEADLVGMFGRLSFPQTGRTSRPRLKPSQDRRPSRGRRASWTRRSKMARRCPLRRKTHPRAERGRPARSLRSRALDSIECRVTAACHSGDIGVAAPISGGFSPRRGAVWELSPMSMRVQHRGMQAAAPRRGPRRRVL